LAWTQALAQKSIEDSSITFAQLGIVYGGAVPGGDLADRFGYSSTVGGEVGLKLRNRFFAQVGCRFLFGNQVKEEIAGNITSLQGTIETGFTPMAIGTDGRWYEVRVYQRGLVIPLQFGYVLPILGKNPNSGVYVEAGGQFLLHNVRIEVPGNAVPGLYGDYSKGYDRLASGFGTTQGIGYRLHNNQRLINFIAGFEFSQNFTQGRRDFQFDTGLPNKDKRLDLMWGFKVAWVFPIYQAAPEDVYYY
jgi:hypothetical protein